MGREDIDDTITNKFDVYARFHKVALCFAVVSTEVYVVSQKVSDRQLKRIQEVTANVSTNLSPM